MKADTPNPNYDGPSPSTKLAPTASRTRRRWYIAAGLILVYLVVAYVLLPLFWRVKDKRHMADAPRITHTANGIPGDPINIALEGSEAEVIRSMSKAGWLAADPITFDSSVRIAVDTIIHRPDPEAPVSSLYLFGRKQALAFEQPIGDSPRQRHHVRFWRWDQQRDQRDVWFGAATLDERVGLSHTTGQVTHHIGPDIDAERDRIVAELEKIGAVQEVEWKNHFHEHLEGKNGGGDPWHTDGRLAIVVLKVPDVPSPGRSP